MINDIIDKYVEFSKSVSIASFCFQSQLLACKNVMSAIDYDKTKQKTPLLFNNLLE